MDAAALDRVYEAFQDFHDTVRRFSVASSGGSVVGNTCKPCWCSPRSGAMRKTFRDGYSVAACAAAFSYRGPLG